MKRNSLIRPQLLFLFFFFLNIQLNLSAQISKTAVEDLALTQQVDSLLKMDKIPATFAYAQELKIETSKAKNNKLTAAVLRWIGIYHRKQEEYALALAAFFQLHHLADLITDYRLLCQSNFELGATYQTMNEKKKAFLHLDKALQQAKNLDDKKLTAYVFNEYGILYIKEGNYEKALEYLILTKKITTSSAYDQWEFAINSNLGVAYALTGKPHKALRIFIEFYKYHKEKGDSPLYAEDCGNIAFAYQKIGKMKEALMYYDSSIYYATKFHQNKVASISYQDLSNAHESIGNTAKAFDAYKKYHQLEKVAISEATQHRITKLEVDFETVKKERELTLVQNEIKSLKYLAQIRLQRIFIVAGGLIALFIISIIVYLRLKEQLKRKEIEEKLVLSELNSQQLKTENFKQRLKNKKADLTSISFNVNKKNDFQNSLLEQLGNLLAALPSSFHEKIKSIITFCNTNLDVNDKLSSQQKNINTINHAFFQKLEQQHGKLTSNEKYLAGSFLLGFSNKDIANQKGISMSAAKMGRYRLRKKLQLNEEIDLVDYLQKI